MPALRRIRRDGGHRRNLTPVHMALTIVPYAVGSRCSDIRRCSYPPLGAESPSGDSAFFDVAIDSAVSRSTMIEPIAA